MNAYPITEQREFRPMTMEHLEALEARLTSKIAYLTALLHGMPMSDGRRQLVLSRRGMVGERLGFRGRIAAAKRTMEPAR
jgi:hypothetical protein